MKDEGLGARFGIAVLVLLGRLVFGDADRSSATCPAVSVEDSFLGFQDWGFDASDGIDNFPVSIIEGGEVALQKARSTVHADSSKYVAVSFMHLGVLSPGLSDQPSQSLLPCIRPSPI